MGGGHVEVEGLLQATGRGVQERPGHGAPDVVDHQVEPPERVTGPLDEGRHGLEVAQVGRHDDGPAPGRLDLLGHHRRAARLVRAEMTTSAPASASATAVAAPMPRPAPVTMATLSVSWNRSRIMVLLPLVRCQC